MDFIRMKKKILTAALGFAAVMLLCTLLSRGIYAAQLPQVETQKPQKRALGHTVEAEGSIEAGSETAVSVIPGLKVDEICVRPGESVSANTVLFTLDQEDLEQKIREQELAVSKLELETEGLRQQQDLAAGKKQLEQNRSLEDYALKDTQEDRRIDQAYSQTQRAQEKLDEHLADQPRQTSQEERDSRQKEYEEWQSASKDIQEQLLKARSELEQAEREEAAARKALEEYEANMGGNGGSGGSDAGAGGDSGGADAGEGVGAGGSDAGAGGDSGGADAGEGVGAGGLDTGDNGDSGGAGGGSVSGNSSVPASVPDPVAQTDSGSADGQAGAESAEEQTAGQNPPSPEAAFDPSTDPEYIRLKEAAEKAAALVQQKQQRVAELTLAAEKAGLDAKVKPDYSAEDAEMKSWESTRESLEDQLEDARTNQENSVWNKLDAMLEARRKVEDASLAEQVSMTLQINQLELEYRREILSGYQELQKKEGRICNEEEGVVTELPIQTGEPAPEGACVRLARLDEAFRFRCILTKEQKKYVSLGDEILLKLGNTGKVVNARVDYLTESKDSPGSYEAYVYLPEGTGSVGMNAVMTASVQSQSFACTIPTSAVYEENEQHYCYVIRRQAGILGEELAVSRVPVNVLDQNAKYTAIEEGSLPEDAEVVVSSSRELGDGKAVRYGA